MYLKHISKCLEVSITALLFFFVSSSFAQISTEDDAKVDFGEKQLVSMLKDRPTMSKFVEPKDKLWTIVSQKFSGLNSGQRIQWRNSKLKEPDSYISNSRYSIPSRRECFIRLRAKDIKGNELNGELLWSGLIFEFFNLENSSDFFDVYKQAIRGELSKAQYIEKSTRLEHKALSKTVRFYNSIWVPEMKKKGIKTVSSYWIRGFKPKYKEWISQYWDESGYPFDSFGFYYDSKIVPYLKRKESGG